MRRALVDCPNPRWDEAAADRQAGAQIHIVTTNVLSSQGTALLFGINTRVTGSGLAECGMMAMKTIKTIKTTCFALLGCAVALLACAREPGDGQDASDTIPTSGGYTGLGKYTGVSGV